MADGTRIFSNEPDYIRKAIDGSLARLQTDHVDLWYWFVASFPPSLFFPVIRRSIPNPDPNHPLQKAKAARKQSSVFPLLPATASTAPSPSKPSSPPCPKPSPPAKPTTSASPSARPPPSAALPPSTPSPPSRSNTPLSPSISNPTSAPTSSPPVANSAPRSSPTVRWAAAC